MPGKQSLHQRITSAFKRSGGYSIPSDKIVWKDLLSSYTNRQPDSFIEANVALVDHLFPKENSMARIGTKAFLIGRNWDPNLGPGPWKNAPGQAFDSGDVTGLQQSASVLLLALELMQTEFLNKPSISEEEIRATLRDPEFQRVLVEQAILVGLNPKVARRIVKEIKNIL